MTRGLFVQAMAKFFSGVILLGLLLFLPAGTLHYSAGWLLMLVLFVPMFLAGIVMMIKSPALLKSRLNMKEKMGDQVQVVALSAVMFVLGFVLAGLSFRFDFLLLPEWVSWAACAAFVLAYLLYAQVLRENAFLSRTIEVQEGQHVVDTGLYGIVRHPMYSATILLFLSMPLILRSLAAFAVFLAYPIIIAKRIRGEEAFLRENLEGYGAYMQKVRWRLIPFVW
ncbi:MAG: isoprenylcysteine carboxylmethyltransferase family protein [Clostridiales bacterium]|nr:isoprenylcysteine carboxylmethyltransferase family protein [Clostridiales bacterium]